MARTNLIAVSSFFAILLAINGLASFVKADEAAEADPNADAKEAPATPSQENLGPIASTDADVTFLLSRPVTVKPHEFPIGKEVHFLVGFKNKGDKDFEVKALDTSFRYAQDFSYVLQNFTSHPYNRVVSPSQETTLGYTLYVSDQYAPRTYGFVVNLLYSDKAGVQYQNTVFNETVSLIEIEDGVNFESFFLCIVLAGFLALVGYGLNKLYLKYVNPSRRSAPKPRVEVDKNSNINNNDVDYDWLPQTMVANLKKTSTSKKAPAN